MGQLCRSVKFRYLRADVRRGNLLVQALVNDQESTVLFFCISDPDASDEELGPQQSALDDAIEHGALEVGAFAALLPNPPEALSGRPQRTPMTKAKQRGRLPGASTSGNSKLVTPSDYAALDPKSPSE
jgi:hypothetical protein